MRRKKHGQSTVEYVAIITIVMAAILAGGVYFKRGVQGRWRASMDDLGEQYDPKLMNTSITQTLLTNSVTQISISEDGTGYGTMRADFTNSTETKNGYSRIASP